MKIDAQLIEALLLEPEGNSLDFKETQYPFSGAADEQKCELLKPVLAFANAFRRMDAYILLGVREIKGKRAEVTGVSEQLEDAHLQQFISGKTQRAVTFRYVATQHDGLPIAVIEIPLQPRPIYTVRTFGKVKAGLVYHRRGSSTAVASPDEIAQMGAADASSSLVRGLSPDLRLRIVDTITLSERTEPVTLSSLLLTIPPASEIPNFGVEDRLSYAAILRTERPDYWRELAAFTRKIQRVRPIRFAVKNAGAVAAVDVRLLIEIPDHTSKYYVMDTATRGEVPQMYDTPMNFGRRFDAFHEAVHAEKRAGTWYIECKFGKIQPHATAVLAGDLYIGAKESCTCDLPCRLFADNLAEPTTRLIELVLEVSKRNVTLDEIEELENERLTASRARDR